MTTVFPKSILWLSLAGALFAGYVSATKFFSGACAFGESCPIVLGYPACYYGLALYLILSVLAGIGVRSAFAARDNLIALALVSLAGVLFAGYLTAGEVPLLMDGGIGAFMLGLPTCAYGLVVYIAILVLSLRALCAKGEAQTL